MSIGKNSIARAVKSTAPAKKETVKKETKPTPKKADTAVLMIETALIKSVKGFYSKEKATNELLSSIKKNGIIAPLFVASTSDGKFYLLDGALRLDAAKTLDMKNVSAVVTAVADEPEARAIYKELKATAKKPEVIVKTEVKEVIVEKTVEKAEPKKVPAKPQKKTEKDFPVYLL